MPKSLNIQDIMEMLPHRFPFLLIDRVVELSDELDRVVAIKNVTMNEPQFTGHFPQAPVMPAATPPHFYFAGIDNARFKRIVQPGDQLVIEGKFIRSKMGMGWFEAVARVDGQVACQASMMCACREPPKHANE